MLALPRLPGAPSAVGEDEPARIRHLLVDEFQDTSPSQVGLIERLTRGWMPDDGRTLFVVGDQKQSIYSFQGADPEYFLGQKRDFVLRAEAVSLTYKAPDLAMSFRSAPEVLSDALPPSEPRAPRERGEFGPSVWFKLSVGHTGRAEARWLLPKICEAGGISRDSIGAIRVQQDETFVQIAEAVAGRFPAAQELESGLSMEKIAGEPNLERPERAPRGESRGAPAARAPRAPRAEKPVYTPKPSRIVEDEADSPARPPRAPREDSERKPYAPRDAAERKPYAKREDGPRKPYTPREDGERKPYAKRDESAPRPYAKRSDDGSKPYAKREDGPRKPYTPREDGERKPYAPREDGDRKPRWGTGDKPAPKSAGYKAHGGSADRPARAEGFKSHRSEGPSKPRSDSFGEEKRPYAPRKDGADARPFAKKSGPVKDAGFKSHAAEGTTVWCV